MEGDGPAPSSFIIMGCVERLNKVSLFQLLTAAVVMSPLLCER